MRQVSVQCQAAVLGHEPVAKGGLDTAKLGVAIIGGGVGGLTCARVMQWHGLEVTVYEREPSRESRDQGGVLDLHPESGQWALIQAGLEAEFRAMARCEGQDLRILDKQGTALWEEVSPADLMERPEVDRPALRALLVDSLQPGTVMWGHQLVSIQQTGEGEPYRLGFANGASMTAGLVVGADGVRSSVRPLLTDAQPAYSGVSFIETGVSDADRLHPEIAGTVGRGSLFALGDYKGIIAQRNSTGYIRIYVAFRMPQDGFANLGITFGHPAATRAAVLAQFEGWGQDITDLIKACNDSFIPRPITAMPVGLSWPSQPSITLLGDAAHQMSPFAGAGANLAMQDGAELALELIGAPDPAAAIAHYEAKMFSRAEQEARQSADGLDMCMSHDGAVVRSLKNTTKAITAAGSVFASNLRGLATSLTRQADINHSRSLTLEEAAQQLGRQEGQRHEKVVLARELPEVVAPVGDIEHGASKFTEDEIKERQSKAVRSWMEQRMGREKVALVQILQQHNVIVRGGQEEGLKLVDALLHWKAQGDEGDQRP
ncbi:hypothetical protein WJX72_002405 [[Myrmecia] bisecta]|uniref:FAD-binding domain-containing protein n=1 Tax=[Myrmecia] bisecta TaxID=41462 RepID=A0AAW1P7M0_9CHLO